MTYKSIAALLKTIAEPNRLEILDLLSCGELCACDLLEHFQFSQPTLSHHMKSLVEQNLVSSRKEGNKTMYNLNHDRLTQIESHISQINTADNLCVCKDMTKGVC